MRYWPIYGGGETITVTLANEFLKRGDNVFVAYTYEHTCAPMPYKLDHRIHSVKLHTIENYKEQDVLALRQLIEVNHIDIMINQWGSITLCDMARDTTKCKLIMCWHLDVIRKILHKNLWYRTLFSSLFSGSFLEKRDINNQIKLHIYNYNHCDKYIFLSKNFENDFKQISKIDDRINKLDSISNPLTYNFNYNKSSYSHKRKEVLFVGRIFEYHKRLSLILQIWRQIENDNNYVDWVLKIVGDGPDMQDTITLANDLNLKRISFEGFHDPRPYYETASIFMMTSAFEGFGMTLVEAQQFAVVPIAMASYGSLYDIIKDDFNGIIIPNNNISLYAEKLKKLMVDNVYRKTLAYNGLASCKKFSLDIVVNKWYHLFNELKYDKNE